MYIETYVMIIHLIMISFRDDDQFIFFEFIRFITHSLWLFELLFRLSISWGAAADASNLTITEVLQLMPIIWTITEVLQLMSIT